MMSSLDGKVALVTGGGEPIGRSIALALAARGVRVVVTGLNERALGETVGEIAYGGGKARHVVGDVALAVSRAVEVFGGLDLVIASGEGPAQAFATAAASIRDGGRMVALGGGAPAVTRRTIGCNTVEVGEGTDPEEVAALVVFLCSPDARTISGRTISLS